MIHSGRPGRTAVHRVPALSRRSRSGLLFNLSPRPYKPPAQAGGSRDEKSYALSSSPGSTPAQFGPASRDRRSASRERISGSSLRSASGSSCRRTYAQSSTHPWRITIPSTSIQSLGRAANAFIITMSSADAPGQQRADDAFFVTEPGEKRDIDVDRLTRLTPTLQRNAANQAKLPSLRTEVGLELVGRSVDLKHGCGLSSTTAAVRQGPTRDGPFAARHGSRRGR